MPGKAFARPTISIGTVVRSIVIESGKAFGAEAITTGSVSPEGPESPSRSVSSGSGENAGSQKAVDAKVSVSIASRSNGTAGGAPGLEPPYGA